MKKYALLGMLLVQNASASYFYLNTEPVFVDWSESEKQAKMMEAYNERCGTIGGNISIEVDLIKSNRPKLDDLINQTFKIEEKAFAFYEEQLKSVLQMLEEGQPEDYSVNACTRNLVISPNYNGHHGDLEQFSVFESRYLGGNRDEYQIHHIVVQADDTLLTLDELVSNKEAFQELLFKEFLAIYNVNNLKEWKEQEFCCWDLNQVSDEEALQFALKSLYSNGNGFYFDEYGLNVVYPHEILIAPMEGQATLTLSYEQLKGIIHEQYLPQ